MKATQLTAITNSINLDKEILKNFKKLNYYNIENFISDAECYIKAIQERRMINVIGKVSASGMSRTIKFTSCESGNNKNNFYQRNYFCFFTSLGYTQSRSKDHYFTIGGCGMDMIFNTNYNIIHKLYKLGFISKENCATLAQQTPQTI
jgi:hypothetical protein